MAKVDLITGFLGAGKTTFIKQYINWLKENNLTFAVIENEFGAAGVDSAMLSCNNIKIKEISGGCICCTLKVNFAEFLIQLSKEFDRIIVEPSGIYNLDDFYEIINSYEVKKVCSIGSVITIIDPYTINNLSFEEKAVMSSQLLGTGKILISKSQEISEGLIDNTINAVLDYFIDNKPLISDLIEIKPWSDFTNDDFNRISNSQPVYIPHERAYINHQRIFSSTTLYMENKYSISEANDIIKKLFNGDCGNVMRIKGYLNNDNNGSILLNCTEKSFFIQNINTYQKSMINVIGKELSRTKIKEVFNL